MDIEFIDNGEVLPSLPSDDLGLAVDAVAGVVGQVVQPVESFRVSREQALPYLLRAQRRTGELVRNPNATEADKIRAQNILFQTQQDYKDAYDSSSEEPQSMGRTEQTVKRGKSIFARLIGR